MARRILVVPVTPGAGVTVACLGLVHALEERHVSVGYCKPFAQAGGASQDHSTDLFRLATSLRPPQPIPVERLEDRLACGRLGDAMGKVVEVTAELDDDHQVLVLEGLTPTTEQVYADRINVEIAQALDAEVLLVGSVEGVEPQRFADRCAAMEQVYRSRGDGRVVGVVVNHVGADEDGDAYAQAVAGRGLACVAVVADHAEYTQPRVGDLVRELDLQVLAGGDLDRRVAQTVIAAQAVPGFLPALVDGALVVAPGDRHDVLLSAALAEGAGTQLAGLLLTAGIAPHPDVLRLVRPALVGGLPLLLTQAKTFPTATRIVGVDHDIPADDEARARRVMEGVARGYDEAFLEALPRHERPQRTTPAQFGFRLRGQMSKGHLRLALTDGEDGRVLQAVRLLHRYDAVRFTVLGRPSEVEEQLARLGFELPMGAHVLDPAADHPGAAAIREACAAAGTLFEPTDVLPQALALLAAGEVDGVVGGIREDRDRFLAAVRAAVPLGAGVRVLSSAQATMLPDEVVFFADPLLNPHPDAEELACIAGQAAETARLVGVGLRIAFVAPSSWSPTAQQDRQAIADARALLAERRPDLRTEGPEPFQHASRRTRSADGDATIFVFPDVASAAATAKAIGQSGGALVHPPVLQGLSRAVNMLPMDASVDGVMDLIIATAVKAADLG